MVRLFPAFLFLLASPLFLSHGLSAPAPKPRLAPLAQYRFNGNARDETRNNADFELKNTSFKDDALYLNGLYPSRDSDPGYRAICRTKKLDYSSFTVALRFKSEDFSGNQRNLITGGTYHRWFGMHRSPAGNVTVTLNNQEFSHEIKGAGIDKDKWTVVACSVDLKARQIVVYVNGKKAGNIDLPKNLKLEVATSRVKEIDKVWSFTNYSNGGVFHGRVDEFIIYGKSLSPREIAAIPLRP